MDRIVIPATEMPAFRTFKAEQNGTLENILFTTWGGIGDQICAEPTLRFALEQFKNISVSLYTEYPELFSHLSFTNVFTPKNKPDFSKFFVFNTITNPETLVWQFMSHCVTHCVDFPSLCSLRCTLPIDYKAVKLEPVPSLDPFDSRKLLQIEKYMGAVDPDKCVAIHAGKHWESKTFPVEWWNEVIDLLIADGFVPVLFGKEVEEHQGTVATKTDGCLDIRNATSLTESIYLLQRMKYLICNDSSPMHMAATGRAHIAFVASAKHQDYLYHWRKNDQGKVEWAWRMKHFNKGGMWDVIDYCPNKKENVLVDKCDPELLKSWLPQPQEIIQWIKSR